MIHEVSANKQSFHTVTFTEGLNVIVAERAEGSTERDTRNGVGKSTLIKIIDFCLGSRAQRGKDLLIEPLAGWEFTLEITLGGNRVKVTRKVDNNNRVLIDGKTDGWSEQADDEESGKKVYGIEKWRKVLGKALFNLPDSADQSISKPSYRSLVSYMVRIGAEAYLDPFKHFSQQRTGNIQLHVAEFLGMNWEYASRFQELKDKEANIKTLEKAVKSGELKDIFGTAGDLETQRIKKEQEIKEVKRSLDSFKVHPQYESIQKEADCLTREIHEMSNLNVADMRLLDHYRESVREEKPPTESLLERLFEESGLVLPENVRRSLSEARTFHSQIVSNRRAFLKTEIAQLEKKIEDRGLRIKDLTDSRAEVMEILKTHGALQEMTRLQERFLKMKESLNKMKTLLENKKKLRTEKLGVKAQKTELVQLTERDYEERKDKWSKAVLLFNEYSETLYESPGNLVINVDDTGYRYKVEINRSGSEGIDKMKIFCFDLSVLQMQIKAGKGINFLVHDTLMYDSVDTRQRARALELAHEVTSALGGQYICTMNSDMIPEENFSPGFRFDEHVRLTLSDAEPSGSLLGMRFERPESDPVEKSS